MVATTVNCFVLALLLIFGALRDSAAYTHKDKEEMVMVIRGRNAVADAAGANNGKLGGRKMMEKMVMGKEEEREKYLEESAIKPLAPKISSANCVVGNCNLVKVERKGLMAFSADYNWPVPHPPKNN